MCKVLHLTASLSQSTEFPSQRSDKHLHRLTLQDHAGLLMVTSRRFDVNANPQDAHHQKVHRAVDNATIATLSTKEMQSMWERVEYFSLFDELKALRKPPSDQE